MTPSRGRLLRRVAFASLFPVLALLAPLLAAERSWAPIPFAPDELDLAARLTPPSARHWLGTDELGRDVASRLVHGSRVSVSAGVVACALALFLGAALGSAAGLGGRRTDRAVLFSIDVVQALPALVLVAAGAAFLAPSFLTAALLIAATSWTDSARLVRAGTRRMNGAPFVEAARAAGASRLRVVFRHVLPHALPPALATAPYVLGAAVLTEAALSFLGLGTPPPIPSWGRALADGKAILTDAPWCVVPPAVALLLLVLSARLLGDALAERR
ncbi:MAG TPA: ABC transporter permease [Thermoanaerobaculia bacterium]|nr:ABC transporter permease [Thermoanaerobaculia bacterium]